MDEKDFVFIDFYSGVRDSGITAKEFGELDADTQQELISLDDSVRDSAESAKAARKAADEVVNDAVEIANSAEAVLDEKDEGFYFLDPTPNWRKMPENAKEVAESNNIAEFSKEYAKENATKALSISEKDVQYNMNRAIAEHPMRFAINSLRTAKESYEAAKEACISDGRGYQSATEQILGIAKNKAGIAFEPVRNAFVTSVMPALEDLAQNAKNSYEAFAAFANEAKTKIKNAAKTIAIGAECVLESLSFGKYSQMWEKIEAKAADAVNRERGEKLVADSSAVYEARPKLALEYLLYEKAGVERADFHSKTTDAISQGAEKIARAAVTLHCKLYEANGYYDKSENGQSFTYQGNETKMLKDLCWGDGVSPADKARDLLANYETSRNEKIDLACKNVADFVARAQVEAARAMNAVENGGLTFAAASLDMAEKLSRKFEQRMTSKKAKLEKADEGIFKAMQEIDKAVHSLKSPSPYVEEPYKRSPEIESMIEMYEKLPETPVTKEMLGKLYELDNRAREAHEKTESEFRAFLKETTSQMDTKYADLTVELGQLEYDRRRNAEKISALEEKISLAGRVEKIVSNAKESVSALMGKSADKKEQKAFMEQKAPMESNDLER